MKTKRYQRFGRFASTTLFTTTCILLLCVQFGFGQAPRTISHQGLLTDPGGDPVADAIYSITFAIYDVSSGGSALWTETKSVDTKDGIFSTDLGSATPITGVNFHQDLWLGIKVGKDPEMTDRTKLASVPSAFGLVLPLEDTLTANGFAYAVPDTLHLSIPGNAFHPLAINTTTVWDGGVFTDHKALLDYATAPVTLPDGAVIETVSCTIHDASSEADLRCRLCERTDVDACSTILANFFSSGDSGQDTYTHTIIGTKVVDNVNKSYTMLVYPNIGPANAEWKNYGEDLEIVRVSIEYTVTRPL